MEETLWGVSCGQRRLQRTLYHDLCVGVTLQSGLD